MSLQRKCQSEINKQLAKLYHILVSLQLSDLLHILQFVHYLSLVSHYDLVEVVSPEVVQLLVMSHSLLDFETLLSDEIR